MGRFDANKLNFATKKRKPRVVSVIFPQSTICLVGQKLRGGAGQTSELWLKAAVVGHLSASRQPQNVANAVATTTHWIGRARRGAANLLGQVLGSNCSPAHLCVSAPTFWDVSFTIRGMYV